MILTRERNTCTGGNLGDYNVGIFCVRQSRRPPEYNERQEKSLKVFHRSKHKSFQGPRLLLTSKEERGWGMENEHENIEKKDHNIQRRGFMQPTMYISERIKKDISIKSISLCENRMCLVRSISQCMLSNHHRGGEGGVDKERPLSIDCFSFCFLSLSS